jgi:hypothetical protein
VAEAFGSAPIEITAATGFAARKDACTRLMYVTFPAEIVWDRPGDRA